MLFTQLVFAQAVDDRVIASGVNFALSNDKVLEGSDLMAFSVNGYVILAGQVLSEEQKNRAAVTANFASRDIRLLINELEVVNALDYSFDASDRLLLSQIQSVIPGMSPATIPVIHNGVVYLLGQVTQDEGNEVTQTISRMQGVKGIRLSFEYTD
jgi:osmotically-inducible protein OsmY